MEYQVRDARITDADRITALISAGPALPGEEGAVEGEDQEIPPRATIAELLRTMVYMPSAIVLVAEAGRRIVGAVVVALRPSLRKGGMIGAIDILAVDRGSDPVSVMGSLLKAALRLARNKGCVAVEAPLPSDPDERSRWEEQGFTAAGPRLVRSLVAAPALTR